MQNNAAEATSQTKDGLKSRGLLGSVPRISNCFKTLHKQSHNRDFMAANCGFVVFAPSAAGLDGNQVLPRRQIEIERELHPCGVGLEKLRLHQPLKCFIKCHAADITKSRPLLHSRSLLRNIPKVCPVFYFPISARRSNTKPPPPKSRYLTNHAITQSKFHSFWGPSPEFPRGEGVAVVNLLCKDFKARHFLNKFVACFCLDVMLI